MVGYWLVMAGYGWLLVITGWLRVIPVFSTNDLSVQVFQRHQRSPSDKNS